MKPIIGKWDKQLFIDLGKHAEKNKGLANPRAWWLVIFPGIRIAIINTRNRNK